MNELEKYFCKILEDASELKHMGVIISSVNFLSVGVPEMAKFYSAHCIYSSTGRSEEEILKTTSKVWNKKLESFVTCWVDEGNFPNSRPRLIVVFGEGMEERISLETHQELFE